MNLLRQERPKMKIAQLFALSAGLFLSTPSSAEIIAIAEFNQGLINDWEEKVFDHKTHYTLKQEQGLQYLHADSQAAASGLVREITIDLEKTPYLNWSWRVNNVFNGNDETQKTGDDYPARLYIIVSGGWYFWKSLALNYVWSSNQAPGQHWPNAYTSNAHMLSLQSGPSQNQEWQYEKRNVREDLKTYFGKEFTQIHAIAIMTDSDNTGASIKADYGDIYFSAE